MQIPWPEIGLVLLLVVINAAFAGSEVALISLREGQLRRLEQEGEQGRLVARLARDPNQFLSTIQIGITLAGFLASAAAAVSLAQPLLPLLGFLGRVAEPVAVLLITIVLTYLTLVVGSSPPSASLSSARRRGPAGGQAAGGRVHPDRPAVWLLSRSTDLLVRLAGADPRPAARRGDRGGGAGHDRHRRCLPARPAPAAQRGDRDRRAAAQRGARAPP